MVRKCLACFLFLFLSVSVFAQDEDLQTTVDYKVDKMTTELKLADNQAEAIRPVIKDYLVKRKAVLDEIAGEGVVDHAAVKITLKALKESESQKLSKILSADQMKKWIDKENLMATLNPDSMESTVDDGASFNANGANIKF